MPVTRGQIIARGLSHRCPNCGAQTLFKEGAYFKIDERCARCGLRFDRGDGFFLGPFVINYGVIAFGFVLPILFLYAMGVLKPVAAIATSATGAVLLPVLLYRLSWSWWLMAYFYFLPQKLPDNRDALREDEEE
ncbi:MAG: DUF983 domain-containing protein [Opitutaceae bacterium]|jgi:uncharacterized protein (DUF983 family)